MVKLSKWKIKRKRVGVEELTGVRPACRQVGWNTGI
jgi:hypothetical protein